MDFRDVARGVVAGRGTGKSQGNQVAGRWIDGLSAGGRDGAIATGGEEIITCCTPGPAWEIRFRRIESRIEIGDSAIGVHVAESAGKSLVEVVLKLKGVRLNVLSQETRCGAIHYVGRGTRSVTGASEGGVRSGTESNKSCCGEYRLRLR